MSLTPHTPETCPGNPECCDECDYLICCTDFNGLCGKCREENEGCAHSPQP